MKQVLKSAAACMVIGILFFSVLAVAADAQEFASIRPSGRAGNFEFYLPLSYMAPATVKGEGSSEADFDATVGFGFGYGYNFNDHFNLSGEFDWSSRNYEATVVNTNGSTQKYNNTMYSSTFLLKGIYYLLSGNIAPFVSGGIGMTYIDTNIPNGPSSGTCWWDPWYGYVCNSYVPTKTEWDVSYSAGVGVRFDINRSFSMQPSYNKTWVDFSKASGIPDIDVWRLDFIFRL